MYLKYIFVYILYIVITRSKNRFLREKYFHVCKHKFWDCLTKEKTFLSCKYLIALWNNLALRHECVLWGSFFFKDKAKVFHLKAKVEVGGLWEPRAQILLCLRWAAHLSVSYESLLAASAHSLPCLPPLGAEGQVPVRGAADSVLYSTTSPCFHDTVTNGWLFVWTLWQFWAELAFILMLL